MENQIWICRNGKQIDLESVSYTRKQAIERLINGSAYTWADCKKMGWKVIKATIKIKP